MKGNFLAKIFFKYKEEELSNGVYGCYYVRSYLKPILYIMAVFFGSFQAIYGILKFTIREFIKVFSNANLIFTEKFFHKQKLKDKVSKLNFDEVWK